MKSTIQISEILLWNKQIPDQMYTRLKDNNLLFVKCSILCPARTGCSLKNEMAQRWPKMAQCWPKMAQDGPKKGEIILKLGNYLQYFHLLQGKYLYIWKIQSLNQNYLAFRRDKEYLPLHSQNTGCLFPSAYFEKVNKSSQTKSKPNQPTINKNFPNKS